MKIFIYVVSFGALLLLGTGCFNEDTYDLVEGKDIVNLHVDTLSKVQANGHESAIIDVNISNNADPSRRNILLKTSLGSFVGGKGDSIIVTANHGFRTEAKLISTKVGSATISATISGLKATSSGAVKYIRAYPDRITVTVDSFAVSDTFKDEIIITASLKSGNGIPSEKHLVTFNVLDFNGNPIGFFLNNRNNAETNESGKASIRFSPGTTGSSGQLKIVADTQTEDLSSLVATTYINLIP